MKIIYLVHQFYPEYQSGTEKFIFNNALMSQKAGNKVKVVTYSFLDDSKFQEFTKEILSREYIYQGIPVEAIKCINPPNFIDFTQSNPQLNQFARNFLKKEDPDLIHVGHPMRMYEFINAAIDLKIPYVMTLTDFFMLCPKVILTPNDHSLCEGPNGGFACYELCSELDGSFIKNRLNKSEIILRKAKALIAPSNFVATMVKKEFDDLNFNVIQHGIQHQYIKKNNRIYNQSDDLIFGFAGTILRHKGVHLLIKTFKEIKNQNIKLKIYGSGPKYFLDELHTMIHKDARISICGEYSSDQLGDILKGIDVVIIPSMCYENYSMVLHEAFASNIPVIVTNLGGLAEKVEDGFNGFTFSFGDSKDLKQKLLKIIENPMILNDLKRYIQKSIIVQKIEQESYEYFRIYDKFNDLQANNY